MKLFSQKLFFLSFLLVAFIYFSPFFLKGLLPIPSDTIVGLYHPFRDLYKDEYPNGIPFKNFLITDPIRQIIPWKELALEQLFSLNLPLWNPYEMAGKPLLGNFQSSPFYPINLLLLIQPFYLSWSVFILLQSLLAGLFLYSYLSNLKLDKIAILFGVIAFCFSGFFISWLEWGTIGHVVLWLPLILLSVDRIFFYFFSENNSKFKMQNAKLQFKIRKFKYIIWSLVYLFSLTSSFFAGHLQIFFYVFVFSFVYFFARWIQYGRNLRILFLFSFFYFLFTIATAVQWVPTLQFILLSARSVDQPWWQQDGWFVPWQHLIQFFAPDFFGNPTTLNYWGIWNYGELVGYIGIVPLIFALFAMLRRFDKKTLFFGSSFFVSLLFALPTPFAKIPFVLNIPFFSTAQPTRLLFISCFSLSILASLGFDYFLKNKKGIFYVLGFMLLIFIGIWTFILFGSNFISTENISVAKRNLYFPTLLLIAASGSIFVLLKTSKKRVILLTCCVLIGIVIFDLLRFANKFTPFTQSEYFFPATKTISFLQKNLGNHRFMTTDNRIFPPNFSIIYRLQSIDGYDPLYLRSYAELIAASERGEPNIDPPFGFNRIITPHNYDSKLIDLMGVKYVLSLMDLNSPKLKKVFQEGQTRVYENKQVLPRAFFVKRVMHVNNRDQAIQTMFEKDFDIRYEAIIEPLGEGYNAPLFIDELPEGQAEIIHYSENKVLIKTSILSDGFLVFTDSFYPTWRTRIYMQNRQDLENTPYALSLRESGTAIFRTNYNFRGILVPRGNNIVEFYNTLY